MSFDEQHEQNLRDLKMIEEDPGWALTAVQRWRELEAEVERLRGADEAYEEIRKNNASRMARIDELERILGNVLIYLQRSQFLVGADALREDIEAVLS